MACCGVAEQKDPTHWKPSMVELLGVALTFYPKPRLSHVLPFEIHCLLAYVEQQLLATQRA